jgi:hypothetical protein
MVNAVAVAPYLQTLPDYFAGDDFGVAQHFFGRPWWYVLTLFNRAWVDGIYGYVPDELRPLVGLTYQVDGWLGQGSQVAFHSTNLILHLVTTVLVFGIARRALLLETAPRRLPTAATAGIHALERPGRVWRLAPSRDTVVARGGPDSRILPSGDPRQARRGPCRRPHASRSADPPVGAGGLSQRLGDAVGLPVRTASAVHTSRLHTNACDRMDLPR